MAKKDETDDTPRKKGGLMGKLVAALVLVAVGGGGVFGLVSAGVIGGAHEEKESGPALVRKGEHDDYEVTDEKDKGVQYVHGEGGSEYRTAYYSFSEEFTSNLKNSDALLQLALAASTQRDGRVLMWLKEHELAIRSQILVVLADTPEEDVYTLEGKERLQKRLTQAINHVLQEEEGFGGIDNVYFRSFIVQ